MFHPGKAGTSGAFTPNRASVKKNEKLVSIAHTHPYDKSEGGFTDVSVQRPGHRADGNQPGEDVVCALRRP